MRALETCLWPADSRDQAMARLTAAAGLRAEATVDPFELHYRDLAPRAGRALRRAAPALLRARGGDSLAAVLGFARGAARLLAPDGGVVTRPAAELSAFLRAPAEERGAAAVDPLLARAALSPARAASARAALLGASLGGEPVAEGWRVRPATPSLRVALRAAGLGWRLLLAALSYAVQLALVVAAWRMVAAHALGGGATAVAPAVVARWVAVLGALVGARLLSSWTAGRLATDGGELLRARLLDGLLALDTEPLRADGVGRLLGRVMETEAVESLALGGGLLALAGVFELATGAAVLALGSAALRELAAAAACLGAGALLAARFWRALRVWSERRLALTHDLVERMVGHRTLIAQQPPERREAEDDRALTAYAAAGRALDRDAALLDVVVPRGWLIAAVAAIAPVIAAASASGGRLAITLGGVLFVYGALRKLTQAFPTLATAAISWRQSAPLFAVRRETLSPERGRGQGEGPDPTPPLITAQTLSFRYPARTTPVLTDCSLEIARGDRVLIEGPSGGGKSTLAALLAGLRSPDAGTLALDGVPQTALGLAAWRARIGAAPQFHENHIFSESLLFNLLLGRAWPPTATDAAEAEALCRDLDLAPLLARMPSGLEQLVGETGWQLSHGEKSRVYIARALLQPLDARILDESFAALDPETLERAIACVLSRAKTLVVIAHP
jgi:ATP-binding cassette subfamily B protein